MGVCNVWVDLICIQQGDLTEKSYQTSLIRYIYSRAEEVIVFLDYIEKDVSGSSIWLTSLITKYAISSLTTLDQGDLSSLDLQCRQVAPFFFHPWFGRLWTLVEVVLSASVRVIVSCGNRGYSTVPYSDVCLAIRKLIKDIRFLSGPETSASLFTKDIQILLDRAKSRIEDETRMKNQRDLELHYIISAMRKYDCSDQRDRVFAALGLADENVQRSIRTDYSKSVLEIYLEVAKEIICTSTSLHVIRFAGLGNSTEQNWPSWVPDWRRSPNVSLGKYPICNKWLKSTSRTSLSVCFESFIMLRHIMVSAYTDC